jgi:hypothetical protein
MLTSPYSFRVGLRFKAEGVRTVPQTVTQEKGRES